MALRLELFPFRYRDQRTGKWVRAHYVAALHEIKQRYAEFEIIGPAEIRDVDPDARYFFPNFNAMMSTEMRRFRERPPELQPTIDSLEADLRSNVPSAIRHLLRQARQVRCFERGGAAIRRT